MSTHVLYSPSSLEKFECCPSFFQEKTITLNPAAEAGTRMHEAVETNDLSKLETEEEIELVNRCLIIRASELSEATPVASLSEVKVELNNLTQGTLDHLILFGDHAVVIDWKFGQIPVTKADTNLQGQAYAAAVLEKYRALTYVKVVIFQPKLDLYTAARYVREPDLERIRLRIMSVIARANVPQSEREETPSEKACMYCSRKSECRALKSIAQRVGSGLNLPVPIDLGNSGVTLPADRAKLQILSHILEDWCSQVRSRNAKCAIEDGIEIPGFEVRSREGSFSVTDLVSSVKLLEQFGIPTENILQACTLSLPKLTDQAVAVKGGKKKELREQLESVIKDYLVRGDQIVYLQKKKGMTYEDIIEECRR